ncbi:MAG TPA: formyltransferase family protein [Candidatus Limnocylindria bacterium]|nr:formyltransferase family protein [Candidatus Limnocylindria bacterium]
MKPRVVLFAYHTFGARVLEALSARGEDIAAVVTHEDDPRERRWFDSVAALAAEQGRPVLTPRSPNTPEVAAALAALAPDMFVSVWYRRLLGEPLLRLPRIAAVNLHGSLLPAYRGRAPVNWVLVNGESRTGVTLHHMTPEADAGDVVAQVPVDIEREDTALTLYGRIVKAGVDLLLHSYDALVAGTAPRIPQDAARASSYGRREAEDGRVEWTWTAARIANMIRAVTHPFPGAFAGDGAARLQLWAGTALGVSAPYAPGCLVDIRAGQGITVAAGDGMVLLTRVQGEGAAEEPADEWAARRGLAPGSRVNPW